MAHAGDRASAPTSAAEMLQCLLRECSKKNVISFLLTPGYRRTMYRRAGGRATKAEKIFFEDENEFSKNLYKKFFGHLKSIVPSFSVNSEGNLEGCTGVSVDDQTLLLRVILYRVYNSNWCDGVEVQIL